MKLLKKRIPALFLVLLVVLSLTVPALAAASSDATAPAAAAETTQTQQESTTGSKSLAAGGAIAMGVAVGKSAEGIARQPEAEGKIRTTLMLGLVFIETAIIYALLVVILIIFVL